MKNDLTKPAIFLKKEAPSEQENTDKVLEALTSQFSDVSEMMSKNRSEMEQQFKSLSEHYSGVKADSDEIKEAVKKHSDEYAEMVSKQSQLEVTLEQIKKEMDAPLLRGGKDLEDKDRELAIELQRRVFINKGGLAEEFVEDTDNLPVAKDVRSAMSKLMRGGLETKENIRRGFTEAEAKAFDAASLDSGFFMPEMLGIEIDCEIECAQMIDLYGDVTVSRSNYMYPKVESYGDIGAYDCDAKCDAELGPEGNIEWKQGQTFDFRGVFCFQKKVLAEANYPLLDFMFRAAARSHRINRNRVLIAGDGINEPAGWLTQNCFPSFSTAGLSSNHIDIRRFIASAPMEYGATTTTMHQNMFAYLAAQTDSQGRFIFGDGDLTFSPDDANTNLRISNCLPDTTAGGTRGNAASPFVAGDFIAAVGNWGMAYTAVNKRPLWMEQFIGGSSAWCVKYQFGAEDGGFVGCCQAARTLVVGA